MLGVLNILNKYFWKSWSGPLFTFVVAPLIMLLTMPMVQVPTLIQASSLSLPIICTGMIVVPQTIFEFKNSAILKRIGAANIKPVVFVVATIIYFSLFMILATILNLLLAMLYIYINYGTKIKFGHMDFYSVYHSAQYYSWAFIQFLNIIMSLSLGFMSATVFKSVLAIQTFGITIIIVTMFLGGAFATFTMVQNLPVLKYFAYLLPYRYTSALSVESWFSNITHLMKESRYNIEIALIIKGDDTLKALLSDPVYGKNFLFGGYNENGELQQISFEKAFELQNFRVTFYDAGKGFIYQTTWQALKQCSPDNPLHLSPYKCLYNFHESQVWNVNEPFSQLAFDTSTSVNRSLPNITTLWARPLKVLSIAMPFVLTSVFFGIAAINFKWSSRG